MERRVSLDIMDNKAYEAASAKFQGLPDDGEEEVAVPSHRQV